MHMRGALSRAKLSWQWIHPIFLLSVVDISLSLSSVANFLRNIEAALPVLSMVESTTGVNVAWSTYDGNCLAQCRFSHDGIRMDRVCVWMLFYRFLTDFPLTVSWSRLRKPNFGLLNRSLRAVLTLPSIVSNQAGTINCALFAIATVTSLALGDDPLILCMTSSQSGHISLNLLYREASMQYPYKGRRQVGAWGCCCTPKIKL